MEELIELYLLKNKNCPLPSLGVLQLVNTNAVAMHAENKINAPVPSIKLVESSMPADEFIHFIAAKKNIDTTQATYLLTQFCDKLQNMDAYNETKLTHAGKFYVNADGMLVFKAMEIPKTFLPEVAAIRVIHPDASHTMVVGDKETTSTQMAAYYSETETASKDRWWLWAAGLAVLAAVLLFFYFSDQNHAAGFGNTERIEFSPTTETYHIAE